MTEKQWQPRSQKRLAATDDIEDGRQAKFKGVTTAKEQVREQRPAPARQQERRKDTAFINLKYASKCDTHDGWIDEGERARFNFTTKATTCLPCLGMEPMTPEELAAKFAGAPAPKSGPSKWEPEDDEQPF